MARKYKVDNEREYKIGFKFKKFFYECYSFLDKTNRPQVSFLFDNKLIEMHKYIIVNLNGIDPVVRVNPLIDQLEGSKPLKINAYRSAMKVYLGLKKIPFGESSPEYRKLAYKYRVQIYGDLNETPSKMALYTCNKCGRPVAVYSKMRPQNDKILGMDLPMHTKNGNSGPVHEGKLSFNKFDTIDNKTLQMGIFFMNSMYEMIKEDGSFDKEYYDKRESDMDWW